MTLNRRNIIKATAAAGALIGATTLSKPAISKNLKQLKMVTTWPKNFPGVGTAAERLAQRINSMSEGKMSVKVYAAGELVPAFESFDAVSQGDADLYHGAAYYWQGKSTAFNFFATVPFGLTGPEANAWLYHAGGQQLWDELAAQFNIKAFPGGNTGVQMGGWYRKDINSLEDFKGLKVRMPGLGGEVLRHLGAAAVALPGGEIFASLQSGAIDGTEWVGPWNDLAFGFYKITKKYYYPGFHEPGTVLDFGVNLKLWDSFSPSEKALLENAAMAENNANITEFNARNGQSLKILIDKHGVELKRFNDTILKEIKSVSSDVVSDIAQKDALSKKIYESYQSFWKEAVEWSKISDLSFYKARENSA